MKFGKLSKKKGIDFAALSAGAVGGAMASNGLVGVVVKSTDSKKKVLGIRGGVALAAGLAGTSLEGTDTLSTVVKGALIGVAVAQTLEVVKTLAADSPSIKTGIAATTKAQKFVASAVGLGCACGSQPGALNRAFRRKPVNRRMALNGVFNNENPAYAPTATNYLQEALN